LNVKRWSDVPQPTEARLLCKDAEAPPAMTSEKIHVVTVAGG
jgi:hypothetical protein